LRKFLDRYGFAGKDCLFHPQTDCIHQAQVCWNLVAGFQEDDIARNHVRAVDADPSTVAKDRRARGKQLADGAHCSFGAALLDEPDRRIRNDDGEDHRRVGHMPQRRGYGGGAEKHVNEHIVEMGQETKYRVSLLCLRQAVRTKALQSGSCLLRAQPVAARSQRPKNIFDAQRVRLAGKLMRRSLAAGHHVLTANTSQGG
jgi:hypothetical protein